MWHYFNCILVFFLGRNSFSLWYLCFFISGFLFLSAYCSLCVSFFYLYHLQCNGALQNLDLVTFVLLCFLSSKQSAKNTRRNLKLVLCAGEARRHHCSRWGTHRGRRNSRLILQVFKEWSWNGCCTCGRHSVQLGYCWRRCQSGLGPLQVQLHGHESQVFGLVATKAPMKPQFLHMAAVAGFEELESLVWPQTCCHSPKCTSILNVCQVVSPLFQKPTQGFAIHMLARGGSAKITGCLGWPKGRGRRVSWCSCRGLYIKVVLFLAHSNELFMDT